MPVINDRTPNKNLALPNISNLLSDDVDRIRSALTDIDGDLASLDSTVALKADLVAGKVPAGQLPSYVDDVLEYANLAAFPGTGETGKIYVAIDTGSTYRWSGSAYVLLQAAYTLPTASDSVLGGVKIGSGLSIAGGVVSVDGAGQSFAAYTITPSTGDQTSFAVPGGYVPGAIIVGLNGSTLTGGGDDYTATDGANVVLTTGISSPSQLQVFVFSTFSVANALLKSGDTMSGDLSFSGLGLRVKADFSNVTASNRMMFQTSTANSTTVLGAIPSGTSRVASIQALSNGEDPSNATAMTLMAIGTPGSEESRLNANRTGTGTYAPMTFYVNAGERMRIGTDGSVGIGVTSPLARFDSRNTAIGGGGPATSGSAADPNCSTRFGAGSTVLDFGTYGSGTQWIQGRSAGNYAANLAIMLNPNGGQVLVGKDAFGYGAGAGGTVTQVTSKDTAVTLHKPTGQITMHNAILAGGASVSFVVNNSVVLSSDRVIVTGDYLTVDPSNYRVELAYSGTGSFKVRVTNVSGADLGQALVIGFAIIKGSTT